MSFDQTVVPHLDAARRLARWMLRHEGDAEDAVQDATLRALRYFATFTGGNARAWFLTIVRNTCRTWRMRRPADADAFDETLHADPRPAFDPETLLLRQDARAVVGNALATLSERSRTLLVRRELEGLSYQELAESLGIPKGTVMSGLSRARDAFRVAARQQLAPRRRRDTSSANRSAGDGIPRVRREFRHT